MPRWGQTFFEKVLCGGFNIKNEIYKRYKDGNNIYTCIGHIRALKKEFYKKVIFPSQSEGEDQFLYLSCISKKLTYCRADKVKTSFRLPNNWKEYKTYARRIFHTQQMHRDKFEERLVRNERKIPTLIVIIGIVQGLKRTPIFGTLYVVLHIFMMIWTRFEPKNNKDIYEVLVSTKKI